MASKTQKLELTEQFIEIWRDEPSLWNVKAPIYKDRNAKSKSFEQFKEKLGMEGLYKCIYILLRFYNKFFKLFLYFLIFYLFVFHLEKEVKAKINTLRSYFSSELKKVGSTKSGDGRDDVYESKWPHFKSLMFLQ